MASSSPASASSGRGERCRTGSLRTATRHTTTTPNTIAALSANDAVACQARSRAIGQL
jgi:hypothetical protein